MGRQRPPAQHHSEMQMFHFNFMTLRPHPAPLVQVAYQGVPGAYSEGAALKACPGWEPLPCEQFEVAFQALSQVGRPG